MRVDRGGNMPFATAAITILLMSVVLTGITAGYNGSSDDLDDVEEQMSAMDAAIGNMVRHIESGIGGVLLDVSMSDMSGDMEGRKALFDVEVARWMDFNMPLTDKGITGTLKEYDIDLLVQSAGMGKVDEGYTPSYLIARGTVDMRLHGTVVDHDASLEVESDGSHGLPLVAGRASLFESMTEGISLQNMISYQLTALAEQRVMNGYGVMSEHGELGTSSILTAEDVMRAYENAMAAIDLICFRTEHDGLESGGHLDLADTIMQGDGGVTIDLSILYAQALYAAMDDMALGWFEYFSGDRLIGSLGPDTSSTQRLSDMIVSFLKGESVHGAESYIEEVMEDNGFNREDYSRPGRGSTSFSYGGFDVTVENPTLDLMSQSWITHFKSDYYRNQDYLMEFLCSVIRGAATIISEERGLGVISVHPDMGDPVSFAEDVMESIEAWMSSSEGTLRKGFSDALARSKTTDPFYGAIADAIQSRADSFVLERELVRSIVDALDDASGGTIDPVEVSESVQMREALHGYRKAVLEDLSLFDDLRKVPGGQPGLVKDIASKVLSDKIAFLDLILPIEEDMLLVWSETMENLDMNPMSGVIDVPSDYVFGIEDEECISYERIHSTIVYDPICPKPLVSEPGCVHNIGFDDDSIASYTTAFRIRIHDVISYTVVGSGPLGDGMGLNTSRISGEHDLSLDFCINVVSGWALAGVDYRPSTTAIDEASAELMDLLSPLVDPLMDLLGMMQDIMTLLMDEMGALMTHVASAVMDAYDKLMGPIERLNGWIVSNIEDFVTDSVLSLLVSVDLGKQFIEVDLYGYTLRISTSALTWVDKTKTLFSITVSGPIMGYDVSAGITVKAKGDVKKDNIVVTGNGSITAEDWKIRMNMDPLMKSSRHLLSVDGEYEDTEISITLPDMEDYNEMGVALSDVPGVGTALSNIPIPGLGVNVGLDTGFSIRLSNPIQDGLIVNEFESNPPGTDRGNETIELMNNSPFTIELDGYTLSACSDRKNKTMQLSGSIGPGEFMVIEPTFLLVNESGKFTKNGEAIVIKDAEGNEIDKTPTLKDQYNDSQTLQRKFDGSTEWIVSEGNIGQSNGSGLVDDIMTIEDLKDIVWYAVQKGFEDVGSITDIDTLTWFIRSLVYNTVDRSIDHITGRVMEMSIYVSVDVSDVTSSLSGGVRVALRTDSQLAADVLKLISGKVEALILGISDPYGIDPDKIVSEDVDLEVALGARLGLPEIVSSVGDVPDVRGELVFRANMASLSRVVGDDTGMPQIECGIRFCDVPTEAIPSVMKPNKKMSHDLWLFRISVAWA